jgi:hypothetical protein
MARDAGDLAGCVITDARREVGMDRIREAVSSVMMPPELGSILHQSRFHTTELCAQKRPETTRGSVYRSIGIDHDRIDASEPCVTGSPGAIGSSHEHPRDRKRPIGSAGARRE